MSIERLFLEVCGSWKAMPVGLLVQHFGPDIHGPQRLNPNDLGDFLAW